MFINKADAVRILTQKHTIAPNHIHLNTPNDIQFNQDRVISLWQALYWDTEINIEQ